MHQNWAGLSLAALSQQIAQQLLAVGILEAEQETKLLFSKVFGPDVWQQILEPDQQPTQKQIIELAPLLQRRLAHEPLSHILGEKGFWTLDLEVNTDVLTPRADTEKLVEVALALTHEQPTGRVLDLGTGSGAVLLAFLSERAGWSGTGIDISDPAIAVAKRNATRAGLTQRANFICTNWAKLDGSDYDLLLSNPPYIASQEIDELPIEVRQHEPRIALDGGDDGLDAYRFLVAHLDKWLRPNGGFAFEIGCTQAQQVTQILEQTGFARAIATHLDLADRERVVCGQMEH